MPRVTSASGHVRLERLRRRAMEATRLPFRPRRVFRDLRHIQEALDILLSHPCTDPHERESLRKAKPYLDAALVQMRVAIEDTSQRKLVSTPTAKAVGYRRRTEELECILLRMVGKNRGTIEEADGSTSVKIPDTEFHAAAKAVHLA
jgi:hypothetical protein